MTYQLQKLQDLASGGDAHAMYQLGLLSLKQEDIKSAFNWLHKAGEQKHTRAIELLGVLILQGHGVKPDPALAFEYFRSAAMTGDAQALMRCAELMFNGKGVNQDRTGAISCLVEAGKQGYPIALRTLGFFLLRQSNVNKEVAYSAFKLAAFGGDPHSQYFMAKHSASVAEANAWLAIAAQSGLYLAIQQYQENSEQIDLASLKVDLRSQLESLVPFLDQIVTLDQVSANSKILSNNAKISVIENAISADEADYLINASASLLKPAKVVKADNSIKLQNIRTGMTASLGQTLDLVVDWLLQRISDFIGQQIENAEAPSVIRYLSGEMYKQHGDYLPHGSVLAKESNGGQRCQTALVYLNDGFDGGATTFTELDLSVNPKCGKLLTFTNITEKAEPLILSQHTGEKIKSGEKWILSVWFRQFAVGRG